MLNGHGKPYSIALTVFLLIVAVGTSGVFAQVGEERRTLREFTPPEAIVSIEATLSFDQALGALNELSKQFLGKIIIDPEVRTQPIGVNIESLHWRDAFERILLHNKLWYNERPDHIIIVQHPDVAVTPARPDDPDRPRLSSREVNISAVFFEINHNKLRESGVNWSFFRRDNKFGEIDLSFDSDIRREDIRFEGGVRPTWSFANVDALIKLFGSTEIGEVIASPEVTVRSGQTGKIQIGADISIKQRDFAGNVLDQFISTGTIITVTPEVIVENGIPFISLDIQAERSTGTPDPISTIIAKVEAETRVLLLDGEETVIGGLYLTEENMVRDGIPVLKDLPWWFFGLKYLFGYNRLEHAKQELVILLRADIVPTLEERIALERDRSLIRSRQQRYEQERQRLLEKEEQR